MDELILAVELLGTVAFASAGAVTGLKKQADLLGVILLGVITSTGGGILRDIILGTTPPSAFVDPVYVITAAAVSLGIFLLEALVDKDSRVVESWGYHKMIFLMDTLGLAVFTVMGVHSAYQLFGPGHGFSVLFAGVVTGVGGGVLRDILVNDIPYIFTKHVYATASFCGALTAYLCMLGGRADTGIWLGAATVVLVRFLADHYHWNLPRIRNYGHKQGGES